METMALTLHSYGYSYGDIASVAITNDLSFEQAIEFIYKQLKLN